MKESIISVVLTLTVLLLTSLFQHNNNLVGAADFSWESISPSSHNNTDRNGANGCIGLHCLIAVDNHETDLFMDQLTGSGNNYEAIIATNSRKPHDCPNGGNGSYKSTSCTGDVSPQYIKLMEKRGCPPPTFRGPYQPGCPQGL
ncbi:hypothetical protein QL285_035896 [Trifolium repens]|nr:hypothetical protein QL285_035896 [Trifolium repens]